MGDTALDKILNKVLRTAITSISDEVHQTICREYRNIINDFYDDYTPHKYKRHRLLKKMIRRRPIPTNNGYICGVEISSKELQDLTGLSHVYKIPKEMRNDFKELTNVYDATIKTYDEIIMYRTLHGIHGFTQAEITTGWASKIQGFSRPYMPPRMSPSPYNRMQRFAETHMPKSNSKGMTINHRWIDKIAQREIEDKLKKYL